MNLTTINAVPDVLEFKSVKDYFLAYYNFRLQKEGHFSYDIWSSELGYKSRSFLPMVMAGQRSITEEFIEKFSDKMKFSETQMRHFKMLVHLEKPASEDLKKLYQDGVNKTLNIDKKRQSVDGDLFSSFIFNPIVKMLISFKDFPATFGNIKKLLGMKDQDLEKSITDLETLGLIQSVQEKTWTSSSKAFEVKTSTCKESLAKFQKDTHLESLEQIDLDDVNKKFRSIYFSVTPQNVSELSNDIEEFLKKLRIKYGSDTLDQQQIMKVNVQSYPLSQVFHKEKDQ